MLAARVCLRTYSGMISTGGGAQNCGAVIKGEQRGGGCLWSPLPAGVPVRVQIPPGAAVVASLGSLPVLGCPAAAFKPSRWRWGTLNGTFALGVFWFWGDGVGTPIPGTGAGLRESSLRG